MLNLLVGWLLITAGFISGAVLGLFFHRTDWLGGYDSFRRRLLRLGHISFFGIGTLNILLVVTLPQLTIPHDQYLAATWGMIVGGVTMPLACGVVAIAPRFKAVFAIPVASLILAGVSVCRNLL